MTLQIVSSRGEKMTASELLKCENNILGADGPFDRFVEKK